MLNTDSKRKISKKLVYILATICAVVLAFFLGMTVGGKLTSNDAIIGSQIPTTPEPERTRISETTSAETPPSPTPPPIPTSTGPELTSRGTLIMEIGKAASVTINGKLLAALTIDSIEVDPACTGNYVRPPMNGHFVVLTGTITTGSYQDFADMPYVPSISLRTGGFDFVSPTGSKTPGNSLIGDSYGCIPEEEMMPNDINIGENASGKLIFDVPEETGSIVLSSLGGTPSDIQGWEWNF